MMANGVQKKEKRDIKEALGEEEETVYSSSDRENMIDEDEITPEEDAFMEGYNSAEHLLKGEKTGKKKKEEKKQE